MIKFRYTLIVSLIISFSFTDTNAQFIKNLDFEERGNIIQEYPAGWFTFSSGKSVYLDSLVHRKGKFSLKSELISENNGMTMIRQEVPKEHVSGKNMALRGWIKSKELSAGTVNLWIRTETEGGIRCSRRSIRQKRLLCSYAWNRFLIAYTSINISLYIYSLISPKAMLWKAWLLSKKSGR